MRTQFILILAWTVFSGPGAQAAGSSSSAGAVMTYLPIDRDAPILSVGPAVAMDSRDGGPQIGGSVRLKTTTRNLTYYYDKGDPLARVDLEAGWVGKRPLVGYS
ncbi:MAG: hypothetical protein AAB425_01265, partial [Bdellovibrionota bacterium]